jgi:hypothetical protein
MLVVVVTLVLAVILGLGTPNSFAENNEYTGLQLTSGCSGEYQDNCIYRQLVYRASFSLSVVFTVLAVFVYCSDYSNRSFWVIKFASAIGFFIALWWGDNSFFSGWAEATRVFSFLWLLVQGLLFIDFAHDAHDIMMKETDDAENYFPQVVYLTLSGGSMAAVIVGLVFLFKDYTGCDMGMFFTVTTLVVGVITTVLSVLDSVNKGLLTPCLVFAYSVFMCWYALLSNPNEACNPTAGDEHGGAIDTSIAVVASVSATIVLYCVVNGTRIVNVFDPRGEGVLQSYQPGSKAQQKLNATLTGASPGSAGEETSLAGTTSPSASLPEDASGSPIERVFFCGLMILVSCYSAMVLTNWGKTNGEPVAGGDIGVMYESQWFKIISQWLFLAFYLKVLHAAYITEGE